MATNRSTVSRKAAGGNRQPPSSISANTVFLACNFNNKRVKRHFNGLKMKWEDTYPLRVYLSDQVKGKGPGISGKTSARPLQNRTSRYLMSRHSGPMLFSNLDIPSRSRRKST
jgi:hypothetical protein